MTLRVFVEGFYTGGSAMNPVLNGAGITDSIRLEVRQSVAPFSLVTSASGLVDTAGYVNFILPSTLWQQSFYFVMRHRNSLETVMEQHLYVCDNDHERLIKRKVFDTSAYFCDECSSEMRGKPQKLPFVRVKIIGFSSKEK